MTTRRDPRTILIVTHNYPPRQSPASRRPAGLAKYLLRLGHRVIVLTSAAWSHGGRDGGERPGEVIACRDLIGTRLNWRRPNMQAYEGATAGSYAADQSFLNRVIVPDIVALTWIPFALGQAVRLARREQIDCVLTTSGPESTHFVGAALRRRGVPWVADLRDGWRFEPYRDWPTGTQTGLDAWLERRILSRADGATAVSEPIAADLRSRLGLRTATIHNGFDPDDGEDAGEPSGLLSADRHSIVHTGRLWTAGRSPRPLIEALRLLREQDPGLPSRLEVILAGPLTHEEERAIADAGLGTVLRHVGVLDHAGSLGLQREADSLLLLTAGTRVGEATGKLFEYLRAGRPILVLGEGTEAARIVGRSGAGAIAPVDDPRMIAAALRDLANGEVNGYDSNAVERARAEFSYPALAERMSEFLREVVGNARIGG